MRTIAVIGQKGGTGKTTLAQILAVEAEARGTVAAIIDLDPQVSACEWGDIRTADSPSIIDAQPARLPQTLEVARQNGVGLAVVDTAGRAEQAALAAAKAANLVLLPLQPSVADLKTIRAAQQILDLAGNPHHLVILTRVKPRGVRHEETAAWLERDRGLPVCPVTLGDRVTYQDAYAQGLVPTEFDPRGKAAEESRRLYTFVCKLVNELTHEEVNHGQSQGDQRRYG